MKPLISARSPRLAAHRAVAGGLWYLVPGAVATWAPIPGFSAFGGGIAAVAVSFWLRITARDKLMIAALVTMLWSGFFGDPIIEGQTVFWVQDLLILLMLIAVLARRSGRLSHDYYIVLVPIAVFALITLPGSLLSSSLDIYLNGLRRVAIAPLAFILGYALFTAVSTEIVYRFLVLTLVLQFPLSVILVWMRGLSLSSLQGPDVFTGTFGRGGSGLIAIHAAAIVGIVLYQFINRRTSSSLLVVTTGSLVVLGMFSDLKFLYILLPCCLALATLMGLLKFQPKRRWRKLLAGVAGLLILVFALSFVLTASSERYHGGELTFSRLLDAQYYRQYLFIDEQGVVPADANNPTRFSRYGAVVFALRSVLENPARLIAGYGLGSAAEGILGESEATRLASGIRGLDASGLSVLIFESGFLGTMMYLLPILLLNWKALRILRRARGRAGSEEVLSGFLLLYGFCFAASLGYNPFGLIVRGGGVFWFIGGLLMASRLRARTAGEQHPRVHHEPV